MRSPPAAKFGAPVLSRGGGTSLAGQCCNVAIVIDWSKYMHGVLEVNTAERWAASCREQFAMSCAIG